MAAVIVDMTKDVAPNYLVTVRFVGTKEWSIRLWATRQLLKLAVMIANMSIKFEDKPWYGTDL